MKKDLEIWVFGDHRHSFQARLTRQVIGMARSLCGQKGRVTVIVMGSEVEGISRKYFNYGAHRVLMIDHKELAVYRVDLFTALIGDLLREHSPDVFLLGATEFGVELASRVSKRLGVGLSAECTDLTWDQEEERLIATSSAFGGQYLARIAWNRSLPYMATLSSGIFPDRRYDPSAQGEILRVEKRFDRYISKIKVISSIYEQHQAVRLEEA